jgi:hypothetical protein
MEVNHCDIPNGGKVRFENRGKTVLCFIEWEDGEYSNSVCAAGADQQKALDNATEKKGRMK